MVIQQKLTAAEFEAFTQRPENVDRLFELINGEIVEKVPSNPYASEIAQRIAFFIRQHIREQAIAGYVTGEAGGFMIGGDWYAPDTAYISKDRGPDLVKQGYHPVPPELAVEVETNVTAATERRLRSKVLGYIEAGVLLWVVYPEMREVESYAPGHSMQKFGIEDTLDGGDMLPELRLPLKEIFD